MTLSSSDNSEGSGALLPPLKPPRSRLRRVLFWILIVLLILIILSLSVAAYIWVNRYALMEDIAIDALAHEGIEAQLSINSVSKTQAKLHNVRLSDDGTEFFSSEAILVDYEWRDMIKGNPKRIVFTRPAGRITLDKTGKIIDGWLPHRDGQDDSETSLPPDGIKIDKGRLSVTSPFGNIEADITAEYFSPDNLTALASVTPGKFSYGDWNIEGGGEFDIKLKGSDPKIKTNMQLKRLEHAAVDAVNLHIKSDITPIVKDGQIDITGEAEISFETLTTAQVIMGAGQLGWTGDLTHKTQDQSPELSMNADWSANIQDLSIPDPIRRRDMAQTLSLSEALGKTPIAQNFAPQLTRHMAELLTQSSFSGTGTTLLGETGATVSIDGPMILKSPRTTLKLRQMDGAPLYNFDKTASEIALSFNADLTQPAGFSLRNSNLIANSSNGWRLDGVKHFSGDIQTAQEWTVTGIDNVPARLSPFSARAVYTAGRTRDLQMTGHINYDGLLPGAVVTGLTTGGELNMTIEGDETALQFTPQDDLPLTIARVDTDTGWRAENLSARLLTQGPIYRRKKESSDVTAKLSDLRFTAVDAPDTRHLDINFESIDVMGRLTGLSQNWVFDGQMANITSEDTPGPGTKINMPSMQMELWREPDAELKFTMQAPMANAETQLVTATNIAISAKGAPDDFTLDYSPGDTQLGEVKFIGEALPPLPMTGIVHYKDSAFTGTAQTHLPFGEDTPIDVSYRFKDGAGTAQVDIPELVFTPNGLQPQSLVKTLRGKIAEVDGAVSAKINLAFAAGQPLQSSGSAQLKSLSFGTLPGPLSGVSTELQFSSFFPLQSQGRQTLTVASFDPGFPLDNGVIEFEMIPDGVKVYSARWPLGGGAISLQPFDWLYSADQNRVVMRVENVSVGEFLKDVGDGAIEATGDIEGTLPIVLSGVDVKVDKGSLEVKNGGVIKYTSDQIDSFSEYADNENEAIQALRDHKYRDAVFQALKEFQYRSLTVKMDGPLDGAIQLGMEFDGSNQAVLNNQPFRFAINIEGELLNILRSFNSNEQIKSELARRQLERESLPTELE